MGSLLLLAVVTSVLLICEEKYAVENWGRFSVARFSFPSLVNLHMQTAVTEIVVTMNTSCSVRRKKVAPRNQMVIVGSM